MKKITRIQVENISVPISNPQVKFFWDLKDSSFVCLAVRHLATPTIRNSIKSQQKKKKM